MSLSELMSSFGRDEFAQVALVLFVLIFAAAVAHVLRRRNAARFERARHLPLDELPAARRDGTGSTGGDEEVSHG